VLLHLMPTPISNFRRAAVFRCQVCLDGRVQPAQCVLSLSFIQLQVSDLLPVACELCCREPLSHSLTPCASAAANGTSGVQVVVSPSLSSPTGHNALCLDKLRACAAPAASPPPIRSSETCCLPFSSGTTGVPKGVVLSHRH
jgi:acyl-CoA synthetase (AMP-forming)/AMP-acid ligase II